MSEGILYIVATPIGNLEDVTLRALRTLKEVDVILAEDTRVTKKLLSKYEIKTSVIRFDAHMEAKQTDKIIERVQNGESFALVTDAGTPGISDPGARLAFHAREMGVNIESVPGPSSLTAALSVAGMRHEEFLFLGFLPHKKGRQTALKYISGSLVPVVLFESTHRILKLLVELEDHMPSRTVTLARELTKLHEEVLSGTPTELITKLETYPKKQKGEFVVIIA